MKTFFDLESITKVFKPTKQFSTQDEHYMTMALELASRALGISSPDPVVGAVIVKNNQVVGAGYHGEFASPHAETWAIQKARQKAKGATIYVTLEPCSHYGNNPPCSANIINAGIKRVVIAMTDPNPLVNGRGIAAMREAGVKVDVGLMEDAAKKQNEAFIKFITKRLPFVTLKSALSLDGKIAAHTKESKWITSSASRTYAHYLRSLNDAILVGVGTILQDDPELTPRLIKKSRPLLRIVIDPMGKTPVNAKVCQTKKSPTLIVVSASCSKTKIRALEKKGCRVMIGSGSAGKINLSKLMIELGKQSVSSVMIEGGGNTAAQALEQDIVDKVIYIYAPIILGGKDSVTAVEGVGAESPQKAWELKDATILPLGKNWIVRGYLK